MKTEIEKSIERYLVISTSNLPKNENDLLGTSNCPCGVFARAHQFGRYVSVTTLENESRLQNEKLPTLMSLFRVAREHGCTWINFDRDAEPLHGAPVWEW